MKYLYLSILSLLLVLTFEFFTPELSVIDQPAAQLGFINSALYVVSGAFFLAFIHTTRIKKESKLILYLVILAFVTLKVLGTLRGIS